MLSRRSLRLLIVVASAAVFAACSSREAPPPASPTPTATVETTPSMTAVASATSGPTLTATPPPSPAPSSTPATGGPSIAVEHGPRESGLVALTFDMGGRVDPALDIMNWLITNEVPATIFMTGAMADNQNTDAGRQVLALVDAHRALFELGNHSYSHADFRTLDAASIRDELERTEQAVTPHTTLSMRPLFRPPYGGIDADVLAAVGEAGYRYTIMWDVDTIDWLPESDGGDSADEMVAKVVTGTQGGSIVLMHLGGYNTFEALPGIVAGLSARGLEPAKVSALLP